MKKLLPYALFSTISIILSVILSYVFDFSLSNSWQAGVVLLLVFGPYWRYCWKFSRQYKEKAPLLCLCLRGILIMLLFGYLSTVSLFVFVGW